jgi:hypothetical protein
MAQSPRDWAPTAGGVVGARSAGDRAIRQSPETGLPQCLTSTVELGLRAMGHSMARSGQGFHSALTLTVPDAEISVTSTSIGSPLSVTLASICVTDTEYPLLTNETSTGGGVTTSPPPPPPPPQAVRKAAQTTAKIFTLHGAIASSLPSKLVAYVKRCPALRQCKRLWQGKVYVSIVCLIICR